MLTLHLKTDRTFMMFEKASERSDESGGVMFVESEQVVHLVNTCNDMMQRYVRKIQSGGSSTYIAI